MLLTAEKLIFIHIPKNAGSSVEKLFGRKWDPNSPRPVPEWPEEFSQHTRLSRYQTLPDFHLYHSFAIVRNPWDRLVSSYSYEAKKARAGKNVHLPNRALLSKDISFKEYVQLADFSTLFMRTQLSWLRDRDNKLGVDTILRMENLTADFARFAEEQNLPHRELPVVNKSKHKHYSEYYDGETIDLVAKIYAEDIEAFGYSFTEHTGTTQFPAATAPAQAAHANVA